MPSPPETTRQATAIHCGAAASTRAELDGAIREATLAAVSQLAGRRPNLSVVFVAAAYGESIRPTLENLSDLIDADCIIAATAEGVLANNKEHESDPAVAVWMGSSGQCRK